MQRIKWSSNTGNHVMSRIQDSEAARSKVLLVHERLCAEYGCPIAYFHTPDPLSELISSLLSYRTKNADSSRAFKQLRERFATWPQVLEAPVEEVHTAIAACTWPEQKAPRLLQVLGAIQRERGSLDETVLDFLGELPVEEARAWLEAWGLRPRRRCWASRTCACGGPACGFAPPSCRHAPGTNSGLLACWTFTHGS